MAVHITTVIYAVNWHADVHTIYSDAPLDLCAMVECFQREEYERVYTSYVTYNHEERRFESGNINHRTGNKTVTYFSEFLYIQR